MKCYRCATRTASAYIRIGGKDLCLKCGNLLASAELANSSSQPELPFETNDETSPETSDDDA